MAKQTTKKTNKPVAKDEKFEPTKMSLAVASAAAVSLVLFAVVSMYT